MTIMMKTILLIIEFDSKKSFVEFVNEPEAPDTLGIVDVPEELFEDNPKPELVELFDDDPKEFVLSDNELFDMIY